MEIYKEWERLNRKTLSSQSIEYKDILKAITSESNSVLQQIKKGLIVKSYWALGFIMIFSILMIFLREVPEALISVGTINLIYIIGFGFTRLKAKQINTSVLHTDNNLLFLKLNAQIIKSTLNFETALLVTSTPLSVICGLACPSLLNGASYASILHNNIFLITALIACIVGTPLTYFLGRKLNRKAFGQHLSKLNKNISELEGIGLISLLNDKE